jgi:hypothetical protein
MQTPELIEERVNATPVQPGPGPVGEGNSGRAAPWLLLLAGMLAAFFAPLADADLPLHLRVGDLLRPFTEWPHTEPVAWTRAGASWFAYSWLPEWLYAVAWKAGGAAALSLVHALLTGLSILAVWDVARRDQWTAWGTRLLLAVHLVLWGIVQPATRPQLILAIAVPLAWGAALRIRDGARWSGAGLAFAAAVMAVNSHLLFPLVMAPVLLLLADAPVRREAVLTFAGATIVGWCVTPYLFDLPSIFALNFAPNALFGNGAAIQEHEPGFRWFTHAPPGMQLLTLMLLVLPLLPSSFAQPGGRLRWLTVSWAAGLVLFALAVRGLLLWWLLALPLTAAALGGIPLPERGTTQRVVKLAWLLLLMAFPLQAWQARTATAQGTRVALPLPHPEAPALEPVVAWLACALAGTPPATATRGAHATTVFNYGSYLAWRVPALSWSVDGRTIFPDSVARAEATQGAAGSRWHPPYGSAIAVVLPPWHATRARLEADPTFLRVPVAGADTNAALLWVRRSWHAGAVSGSAGHACGDGAQP